MNETCGGPSAEFCCNLKELTLYGNGEIPNVEAPIARAGVSDFRRLNNIVPFSSTSFHYLKEFGVLTLKLRITWMEGKQLLKKEGDGDGDLNATIKEYWEAKLETCDQKFAEKIDASDGEGSEHDANYDLERETTSEVRDTQCDGE
ncbi:hypothetical protein SO802_012929 [Lithocarpus litseifolius]|uniref:Uncharacterized protein n=1 Tax=Lithocarpus litseifolius TaxID=425828 RepID=A0AAW2D6Q0_9ROSI